MNPLATSLFLPQVSALLDAARPEAEIVRYAKVHLLRPLLARGRPRRVRQRGRSLQKALAPWLANVHVDSRRRAVGIFLATLDVAESRVLPDLDPLIGAALFAMRADDWTHLLHEEIDARIRETLFPRPPRHVAREDLMIDFWGFELTTIYKASKHTYMHEIESALEKTGKAGGLLRMHAKFYFSSMRPGGAVLRGHEFADLESPDESPDLLAQIEEAIEARRKKRPPQT